MIRIVMLLVMLCVFVCTAAYAQTVNQNDYPGKWDESVDIDISKLIVSYKMKNCGEYRYKYHKDQPYTYLLQCARDGKKWSTYFVRLDLNLISEVKK